MGGEFLQTSRPVLDWVLRTTWEASVIAALVLVAQWLLRGRVSARWRYNLWLLVVARLLLPAVPGTQYSPFNLVQRAAPAPTAPQQRLTAPDVTPAAPRPQTAPPASVVPVPDPAVEPERQPQMYLASTTKSGAPVEPRNEAATEVAPARGAPPGAVEAAVPTPEPPAIATSGDGVAPEPVSAPALRQVKPDAYRAAAVGTASQSETATTGVAPWHKRVNWLALGAMVWVAGAAFVAARLAWVTLRLSAAVRGLKPVRDPALAQLLAECAASLRLRRLPVLLEGPDTFGPALVGLLRPRIVLPECILRGSFHRDELRLILMHELAHMKRWDVGVNWVLAALTVLHWFNPGITLAFRRMRIDREMACDELVLSAASPGAARVYGPTILKLLQTLSRGSSLPGMVGVLEGKTNIRRRIAMIARFDRTNRNSSPLLGAALTFFAGGVALTGAAGAQFAPPPADEVDVRPLVVEPAPAGVTGSETPESAAAPGGPELDEALAPAGLNPLAATEASAAPPATNAASSAASLAPAAAPGAVIAEAPATPPATVTEATAPASAIGRPGGSARGAARGGYGGGGSSVSGAPGRGQGAYGAARAGGAEAPAAAPAGGYGGYPRYPGYGGSPGMGMMPGMPGATGARGAPADGHVEDPAARGANTRAAEALRKSLPVNFQNVALDDTLRFISDATDVDVITDWKSLESVGVDRGATVTLTLKQGAPAEQVLHWILRAAGGDAVGYALDHGVVVVAAQERVDRMVITRAYKLGSLAGSGQALENLVRDTVAPQSWRENGGAGSVRFFNGQLFVTATEPNHRQVERLLGLMDAQGMQAPAPGGPGMMPGGYPGMMPGAQAPAR